MYYAHHTQRTIGKLYISSLCNHDISMCVKQQLCASVGGAWDLTAGQCLSQDLETGCLKLAFVKFLGVQIFKGDHNILIFQP